MIRNRSVDGWVTAACVPVGGHFEFLRLRAGTRPLLCTRFGGGSGSVTVSTAHGRRAPGAAKA